MEQGTANISTIFPVSILFLTCFLSASEACMRLISPEVSPAPLTLTVHLKWTTENSERAKLSSVKSKFNGFTR
jgi:hypothetical protein